MKFLTLFVFVATFETALAQKKNNFKSNLYEMNWVVGAGVAKFQVKGIIAEEYPTFESRVGVEIARKIINKVSLGSGVNFAFRSKRKSYFKDGIYSGKGTPVLLLDDTSSKKNHLALEIPIKCDFPVGESRSIQIGILSRFWFPNNLNGDVLRSKEEIGLILGGRQKLLKNLIIGFDYYQGFNNLYPGYSIGLKPYTIKNNFYQITFLYNTISVKK